MKYIVLILSIFLLFSCGGSPKEVSMENDKGIDNIITLNPNSYDQLKPITFWDKRDVNNFKNRLVELDKEIDLS